MSAQPASPSTEYSWVAKLPLARDPVFVRQMALVFFIPWVVVGLLLLVLEWPPDLQTLRLVLNVVLGVGALMLALYAFVIFGVLRGRQEIRYTLDETGIREQTAGFLKYMNWVRLLLILSGRPTYMGIGLITQGPTANRIPWEKVQTYTADAHSRTITLRQKRTDLMVVHCTPENFERVLAQIQTKTKH